MKPCFHQTMNSKVAEDMLLTIYVSGDDL